MANQNKKQLDLHQIIGELLKNKTTYTNANTGKAFEDNIMQLLKTQGGFNKFIAKSHNKIQDKVLNEYLTSIKDVIQSKTGSNLLNNDLSNQYGRMYVHEPYGSQNYPDFLIFTEHKIYSIETKYSAKNGKKPMWNGNLPKSDGIYIFGSYGDGKQGDITFFRGEDVLPEDERKKIMTIWDKTDLMFDEWKKEIDKLYSAGQLQFNYGFMPYIREAYEQKKIINNDAIVDFLKNPARDSLEQKVINFIKQTDVKANKVPSI